MKLFSTGFLQVFFVAINTIFLANHHYIGVIFSSFAISITWSFNVKKIAFSTMKDRVTYSAGASAGSIAGLLASALFL